MEHRVDTPKTILINAAASAPSVGVLTAQAFGVTLSYTLTIVSIIFIVLQITRLLWNWWKETR